MIGFFINLKLNNVIDLLAVIMFTDEMQVNLQLKIYYILIGRLLFVNHKIIYDNISCLVI